MKLVKTAIAVSILGLATSANAALDLSIYENANGDVVFNFSGSDVVTQNNSYNRNGFWFGDVIDNLYTGSTGGKNATSTTFSAMNVTQGGSSSLDDVYLNGGSGHEIGIRLNNCSILTGANNGDTISWSGQVVFDYLDISDFMASSWSGNSLNAGDSDELILDGGYNINIAAVPEPSTYALMIGGLGLVGLMAARRRKQA